ncbi:hypothetical protein AB0G82_35965, partial [Streptomyces anulatus]|uniref:hypothetical protein n=1 Tax=Streptomyces anulatus TaxID=1892 RepID=UPI0034043904
ATLDDDTDPVRLAAADAALAASGLIDAARLQNTGASPSAIRAARDAAALSLRAAADGITTPPDPGGDVAAH